MHDAGAGVPRFCTRAAKTAIVEDGSDPDVATTGDLHVPATAPAGDLRMVGSRLEVPTGRDYHLFAGAGTARTCLAGLAGVFDAAVAKAYGNHAADRLAQGAGGEEAFSKLNNWLPDETESFRKYRSDPGGRSPRRWAGHPLVNVA